MINPMLQNLNQNRFMQTMKMIKSVGNPQMMIQQMPQYKQVMDYIEANGGDAKNAFYTKAKEMGLDPDEIVNVLQNINKS